MRLRERTKLQSSTTLHSSKTTNLYNQKKKFSNNNYTQIQSEEEKDEPYQAQKTPKRDIPEIIVKKHKEIKGFELVLKLDSCRSFIDEEDKQPKRPLTSDTARLVTICVLSFFLFSFLHFCLNLFFQILSTNTTSIQV